MVSIPGSLLARSTSFSFFHMFFSWSLFRYGFNTGEFVGQVDFLLFFTCPSPGVSSGMVSIPGSLLARSPPFSFSHALDLVSLPGWFQSLRVCWPGQLLTFFYMLLTCCRFWYGHENREFVNKIIFGVCFRKTFNH